MNPDRCPGQVGPNGPGRRLDLVRKTPAIGVAQNQHLCAGLRGALERRQRIGRILGIGVEEMLSVNEDPAALGTQV